MCKKTLLPLVLIFVALSSAQSAEALTGPVVYSQDFEGAIPNWVLDAPWAVITSDHVSGTKSLTDRSGGLYANNADTSAKVQLDFTAVDRPVLTFSQRYNLENYADFGYVEVSTDGTNWRRLFFTTGSSGTTWASAQVNLSDYAYQPSVWVRFRLITSGSGQFDGWYIDDVQVINNTTTLAYPFFDDMETTASTGNWIASTWARIGTDGHSGTHSWTDSPGGASVSGVSSSLVLVGALDLSGASNPQLSFWQRSANLGLDSMEVGISVDGGQSWTQLAEYHPGGLPYLVVAALDPLPLPPPSPTWAQVQFDLSQYVGLPNVLLRFTVHGSGGDGWSIDDILIDEACSTVFLNPPTNAMEHNLTVSWSKSSCADFQQYEIYRSAKPDLSASTLITTITDPMQTTYADNTLTRANATYYYKVVIVDGQGLRDQGSNLVSGTTLDGITDIPLGGGDDMESGDRWGNDLPWGLIQDPTCHSGTYCWHDSPAGPYPNDEDITLTTRLNLSAGGRPLFKFWERYNLESYADVGYVEVSTDGTNWTKLFFATGFTSTTWREEAIDLSQYAFKTIWLRFRLITSGSGQFDGWYIDDIQVINNTTTLAYPFFDDMETTASTGNWIASTWARIGTDGHSGTHSWTDSPGGASVPGVSSSLVLAGALDLGRASNPQLSFWQRSANLGLDSMEVGISVDGGQNWVQLAEYHPGGLPYLVVAALDPLPLPPPSPTWTQVQLDLSQYVGLSNVLLRFTVHGSGGDGWSIDDVFMSDNGITPTPTVTPTQTPSSTPTFTSTRTSTPTVTPTRTLTATQTPTIVHTATATATASATATLTATATPSPTATATPTPINCLGDCNDDGSVTVDELLTMVNIALGNTDVSACGAGDANQDRQITIDEILTAVNNALDGCG